jgi:hypothetical protein
VAVVRTDVSEDCIATISRVQRISELGSEQFLVTANVFSMLFLSILMVEAIHSSETLVLTRATWHHIPEDSILHE